MRADAKSKPGLVNREGSTLLILVRENICDPPETQHLSRCCFLLEEISCDTIYLHMKKKKYSNAFTLIELLVVIAIIGILSSVVLASLSGARESAKITKTVSDLEQIETALTMWMQNTRRAKWPHPGNDLGGLGYGGGEGGDYVVLSTLNNQTGLDEYLTSVPGPPFNGEYEYHNDYNESNSNCGQEHRGTNIDINNSDITTSIAKEIDQIIDQEIDLNCGKLRYNNGRLWYSLSMDNSF